MVTKEDQDWLHQKYPGLIVDSKGIHGMVHFTATYNEAVRLFQVLGIGIQNTVGGIEMSGDYEIDISERTDKKQFRSPALRIAAIDPVPDRHFSPDKTACLGSSLEEDEFFTPDLQFQKFFEKAVIPFLYGQAFYSANARWPWHEYGHGIAGLFESYLKLADPSKATLCLEKLFLDKNNWLATKLLLESDIKLRGHTPCPFCIKRDHLRRCHPDAWKGFCNLRRDVRANGVALPDVNETVKSGPQDSHLSHLSPDRDPSKSIWKRLIKTLTMLIYHRS